jgi:predicted DsbA family dithiol-disulfide isomerase/uncharacterized membrane protein
MASKGKQKRSAAQRAQIARAKSRDPKAPAPTEPGSPKLSPMPAWVFWGGTLLLLAMAALSLNLSLSHLGFATPGCGEGGSCDAIKQTKFAYLPFTYSSEDGRASGWPVAYVGFAYFASLLVVWVMSSGVGLNSVVRNVIRVGAAASLFYVIVMLGGFVGGVCPLCLATHILNFALLGLVEFAVPATAALRGRSIGVGLAGLLIGNGVLLGVQSARSEELARQADAQGEDLIKQIMGGNGSQEPPSDSTSATTTPTASDFDLPGPTFGDGRPGFTGRYLIGPEDAPIRIVTVSGYQCEFCQTVEAELKQLIEQRDDVSLSLIQFPANSDCNPTLAPGVRLHPGACQTSQMAEAAGILGGPEAFWAMSFRLFEYMSQTDSLGRKPSGVPASTVSLWARELGLDANEFNRTMSSSQVAERIAQDTRLARSVGTTQTPMVFINGVEYSGWNSRGALTRTVERLAEQNPPRSTSANDQPPSAGDRLVDSWRSERTVNAVPSGRGWLREGDESSGARIVVWGCYDEENTQRVDRIARDLAAQYPGASYEFRFFPFNSQCNPRVNVTRFTQACPKAKAAVAAGLLGGAEAHHAMHDWIMDAGASFDTTQLRDQFTAIGLDPNAALDLMESAQVAELIVQDSNALQAMQRLGIRSRPAVFVNEKPTPWIFGTDQIVLPDIVRAALGEDGG